MEMDHPYGSGHVCSITLFWERGGLVERRDENIIKFTSRLSLGGGLTEDFTVANKTNRKTNKQTKTVSTNKHTFHFKRQDSILCIDSLSY